MKIFEKNSPSIELYNELQKRFLDIDIHINKTLDVFLTIDENWFLFWDKYGFKHKIEAYLLRYVLTLYEQVNTAYPRFSNLYEVLALELASCITWRAFDNIIDSQHNSISRPLLMSKSIMDTQILCRKLGFKKPNILIANFLEKMTNTSIKEKQETIDLNNIYTRCSIFLLPFEISKLDLSFSLEIFKKYINYTGIAHDIHDFYSDYQSNTLTLPVIWMQDSNPNSIFSIKSTKRIYHKAQKETEHVRKELNLLVSGKFPILEFFINEATNTLQQE